MCVICIHYNIIYVYVYVYVIYAYVIYVYIIYICTLCQDIFYDWLIKV